MNPKNLWNHLPRKREGADPWHFIGNWEVQKEMAKICYTGFELCTALTNLKIMKSENLRNFVLKVFFIKTLASGPCWDVAVLPVLLCRGTIRESTARRAAMKDNLNARLAGFYARILT